MKKLLISDFDRTLYRDRTISPEDLAALARWQQAGNRFAIATGRAEEALRTLLEPFALHADALICSSGACIVSWAGQRIFEQCMDADTAFALVQTLLQKGCPAVDVTLDTGRVQVEDKFFTLPPVLYPGIQKRLCIEQFRPASNRVLQVHARFFTTQQTRSEAWALEEQFPRIAAFANEHNLDIVCAGLGKAAGVQTLLDAMQFEGRPVAIGDSFNDLEMLQRYQGYTLYTAAPEMQQQTPHLCESVADCIQQELEYV